MILIACGILASLLYVAMLVFIPMQWEAYSSASQAISELSALAAPTRVLWVAFGMVYTLLMAAFGWGVWTSARGSRALRVVGGVLVASEILGLAWPPMHLRGTEFTLTDTLHIVWTAVTLLGMLLAIGFGAAAFGKRFRLYSVATIVVFAVFGTLTALDGPKVAANLPTPWMGVWERINAGAYMLWVVVFAVALMRRTLRSPSPGWRGGQGVALVSAFWLSACAPHQPPVPVVGPASDIAALAGEWTGEYSSSETGRSGSISFVLAARGDTAYGDVIMIPRGFNQPLRAVPNQGPSAAEQSRAEALTISFVRVSGNEVSGVLAPYRDPECGCTFATRFVGWLRGDTIAGAYFSHHERSEAEAQGRWNVVRKPRGPSDGP